MTGAKDIREELDWVAELMTTASMSAWPAWVAYLLEVLDEITQHCGRTGDYERVLGAIRHDIRIRMELGCW